MKENNFLGIKGPYFPQKTGKQFRPISHMKENNFSKTPSQGAPKNGIIRT